LIFYLGASLDGVALGFVSISDSSDIFSSELSCLLGLCLCLYYYFSGSDRFFVLVNGPSLSEEALAIDEGLVDFLLGISGFSSSYSSIGLAVLCALTGVFFEDLTFSSSVSFSSIFLITFV
jgi:hypothetical protein